jgi:ribosome-associated protein
LWSTAPVARIAYELKLDEVEFGAVRAQGPGGQNVNKVSSAVTLRLDVNASSLPDALKARVIALGDRRLNADGVLVIKAQDHRSQPLNRAAAIARLREVLDAAAHIPTRRVPTKPSLAARRRRVDAKVLRGRIKALRTGGSEG